MAITLEYAKCGSCGRENAKSLPACRNCGTALGATKSTPSASNSARIGVGDVAWKAMSVQIAGGIIFLAGVFFWFGNVLGFFPTFPGLGYIVGLIGSAIWGAGSQMED